MNYNKKKNVLDRVRGHELLPQSLLDTLPGLYATDGQWFDAIARVKIFHPLSDWYWYLTEYDSEEIFYGLVFGHTIELGYISRSEIELGEVRGLPFERDLSFKPQTLREIVAYHKRINPHRDYPDTEID